MELRLLSETATTITLGWDAEPDAEWFLFYANGMRVANGPAILKNGVPRTSVKFAKGGEPYEVAVMYRTGPAQVRAESDLWSSNSPLVWDYLSNPYASGSWVNAEIPANPNIHPDSAAIVAWAAANRADDFMPTFNSTPSFYVANTQTPRVNVRVNYPMCSSRIESIPIPSGAHAGHGSYDSSFEPEPSMMIYEVDTGFEWGMFKITEPFVTPLISGPICNATADWAATVVYKDIAGWHGNGIGYSTRGSGVLLGPGLITPEKTKLPIGSDWGHALVMAYTRTRSGSYYAPATMTDGTNATSDAMPLGACWQITSSYDIEGASAPEWQKQMMRTIRKYGLYVVDTGAAISCEGLASTRARNQRFAWEDEGGWIALPRAAVAAMRVVIP